MVAAQLEHAPQLAAHQLLVVDHEHPTRVVHDGRCSAWGRRLARLGFRQNDGKTAAFAGFALEQNGAAVARDDAEASRQAEAMTVLFGREEGLEYALACGFVHADAAVF